MDSSPPLADFTERLARALAGRTPSPPREEEGVRRAAVAVVVGGYPEPAILFVKRMERDGDPWSGQIAFPGGFRASLSEALRQTAVREAEEETGLDLAREAEFLGVLDEVAPRTPFLPPIAITPFVFRLRSQPTARAGPEVARVLWLTVRALIAPESQGTFSLDLPSGERSFPAIVVGEETIWGLTERVLRQVLAFAAV